MKYVVLGKFHDATGVKHIKDDVVDSEQHPSLDDIYADQKTSNDIKDVLAPLDPKYLPQEEEEEKPKKKLKKKEEGDAEL